MGDPSGTGDGWKLGTWSDRIISSCISVVNFVIGTPTPPTRRRRRRVRRVSGVKKGVGRRLTGEEPAPPDEGSDEIIKTTDRLHVPIPNEEQKICETLMSDFDYETTPTKIPRTTPSKQTSNLSQEAEPKGKKESTPRTPVRIKSNKVSAYEPKPREMEEVLLVHSSRSPRLAKDIALTRLSIGRAEENKSTRSHRQRRVRKHREELRNRRELRKLGFGEEGERREDWESSSEFQTADENEKEGKEKEREKQKKRKSAKTIPASSWSEEREIRQVLMDVKMEVDSEWDGQPFQGSSEDSRLVKMED